MFGSTPGPVGTAKASACWQPVRDLYPVLDASVALVHRDSSPPVCGCVLPPPRGQSDDTPDSWRCCRACSCASYHLTSVCPCGTRQAAYPRRTYYSASFPNYFDIKGLIRRFSTTKVSASDHRQNIGALVRQKLPRLTEQSFTPRPPP